MPKRISKQEAKKFIRDGLTRRDQIVARLKAITDEERRLNKEYWKLSREMYHAADIAYHEKYD
jgi:hypothetical protein